MTTIGNEFEVDPAGSTGVAVGMPGGGARPPIRVLFLAQYLKAPSFRLRGRALAAALEGTGRFECRMETFEERWEWWRIARIADRIRWADVVVVSKLKLLAGERQFVGAGGRAIVWDLDDAVMIHRPRRDGEPLRIPWWRRLRFERMIAASRLVVAGSRSLSEMIGEVSRPVVIWPTPLETGRYRPAVQGAGPGVRLVWSGLGSNVRYLKGLVPAFRLLEERGVPFELNVVSDRLPDLSGIPVTLRRWSEMEAPALLAEHEVGLAPLPDDGWTRGKAAFRCVEYAAAGLPCVASPSGAQNEVVVAGETGLFADTPTEWADAIERLARSPEERARLGSGARRRAERLYDIGVLAPVYGDWIESLARRRPVSN